MKSKLLKRGFMSLVATQFFGAMNDNILKGVLTFMVINGLWSGSLGPGGQGIVSMCFTIPFILLSGYAGQVADRFSKRTVTFWVKSLEIPIAVLAGIGFYTNNLWITLAALVALTCQSAFFGPAKYGMILEFVGDRDLSRANGTINMMTNLAVIVGTLLAGFVSDRYSPQPVENVITPAAVSWLPGAAMVGVAIVGLVAALFMTPLKAGDRALKWDLNPFTTYLETIREMARGRLLMVMMAWGYFYMLAWIALMILPEYTDVLAIDRAEASVLMGVMGIAIGLGCAVAGLISGHRIEPRLVPVGAVGMVVFFALLGAVPPVMPDYSPMVRVALSNVAFFVLGAGFFAGFYIVPLQALLQKLSPDDERGRFLGTANAVSFTFLTVGALIYWVIRPGFGEAPQHIFYVSSVLMAVGAGFFLWRLRGTGVMVTGRDEAAGEVTEED
ncbi:MAG: MFS transporter [Rubripirellula sp.]|nr:MFS transporter [Rubripirellula sp.]